MFEFCDIPRAINKSIEINLSLSFIFFLALHKRFEIYECLNWTSFNPFRNQ